MALVTKAAFATLCGKSRTAIYKAISVKHIILEPDSGKINTLRRINAQYRYGRHFKDTLEYTDQPCPELKQKPKPSKPTISIQAESDEYEKPKPKLKPKKKKKPKAPLKPKAEKKTRAQLRKEANAIDVNFQPSYDPISELPLESLTKDDLDKLKIIQEVENKRLKNDIARKKLISTDIIARFCSMLHTVDIQEILPIYITLVSDLAALWGIDDTKMIHEGTLMGKKIVYKALDHRKRIMDEQLADPWKEREEFGS